MTAVEDQRYQMHSAFRQVHGEEVASVIMEHLPPAGWSHLATKSDVDNARLASKSDIDNLRIELKADMQILRSDLQAEMQVLRADMQSLRSDLQADLHRLHASGLRWTVGLVFAGNAALLSVASFLN